MTGTKTVAERLREIKDATLPCRGDVLAFALGRKADCPLGEDYINCIGRLASELADAIEAAKVYAVSKALNDAKSQLPEGVIWPTYEDGELVKPFDKLPGFDSGGVQKFIWTSSHNGAWQLQDAEGHMLNVMHGEPVKRPEPEVLDADGVTIKVGDTVYKVGEHPVSGRRTVEKVERVGDDARVWFSIGTYDFPEGLTHRKPDTFESIFSEMVSAIESEDCVDLAPYVERYRKLKGGE